MANEAAATTLSATSRPVLIAGMTQCGTREGAGASLRSRTGVFICSALTNRRAIQIAGSLAFEKSPGVPGGVCIWSWMFAKTFTTKTQEITQTKPETPTYQTTV